MSLVVQGGHVVNADGVCRADVVVDGGIIEALTRKPRTDMGRVLNARGCLVFPGLVDTHVHMGFTTGEFESTDDFESGSRAAAHGGVTTLVDFAIPARGEPLESALGKRQREAQGTSHVDFGLHVVLSEHRSSLPQEIRRCIELGVTSFKLFTIYPGLQLGAGEIFELMTWIAGQGALAMVHAEDAELVEFRRRLFVEQGLSTPEQHLRSRPALAEAMAVGRVLAIQGETGCPVHFAHVSSGWSTQLIESAKTGGGDVSAETCPQYLTLDSEVYSRHQGHRFLVSPAVKTRSDQVALWAALQRGVLDTVATDHCPFSTRQKDAYADDFTRVPTGLPGVETTLPLLFTAWHDRSLPLELLAALTSTRPARRFGLFPRKGTLAPGGDADLVVYDPEGRTEITADALHMNVDWSPYEGRTSIGRVRSVVSRGRVLIEDGRWSGEDADGEYLTRELRDGRCSQADQGRPK